MTTAAVPSLRSALRAPLREGTLGQPMEDDHRSTPTDARWGHFRPSRRGQCKPSLSTFRAIRRGAVIGLVCAIAALGIAMPSAASATEQPVRHLESVLKREFSIFKTPPEHLPAGAPPQEIDGNPGLHLNNALAQRVDPPGGPPVWLIPGRGFLRILIPLRPTRLWGTSFASTAYAIEHGLGSGIYEPELPPSSPVPHPPRHHRAIGLVPDGVVAVELEDGIVAKVQNNVYSKRVAHRETSEPVFIWQAE